MSENGALIQEPGLLSPSRAYLQEISCLQERIQQLENCVEEQQSRNNELEQLLSRGREQLDEESFKREILEFDLNQHKEALLEKAHELQERDQTIDTQNCLLGIAWTDAQSMATAQRERDQTIKQLRSYIDDMSSSNLQELTETNASKKRRLSP